LEASDQKAKEAEKRLQGKAVDEHITQYAVKAGIDPDVLPDVLMRARGVFQFKDDQVVAMKGDLPLFSEKDPAKPLGADEWLAGLPKVFFKPNFGGGAQGGGGNTAQTLRAPSPTEFGKNLEGIASGKVQVV
jgi:hypothetical protein